MFEKNGLKRDGLQPSRGIILGHVFGGAAFVVGALVLGTPVHEEPEPAHKVSVLTDSQIHCVGRNTLELTLNDGQNVQLTVKDCKENTPTP
jgi:hypothetical protein